MNSRLLIATLLTAFAVPALAHDPNAHSRRPAAPPAECAAFEGKDPKSLDLMDPAVKAAYETCEAEKKSLSEAAKAKDEHDH